MLIRGDARLLPLRDRCVQTVVTSPPYWGLRDYGIGGQLGLEPTPDAYVAALVAVFREVRRVLREDGTCWINLGDSYANTKVGNTNGGASSGLHLDGRPEASRQAVNAGWIAKMQQMSFVKPLPIGLKSKDLVGIPWRVAFALQADGWYLRSDIIWAKPNPMPESVTDRPTKAHEYLFLLSKAPRYYYDADAVRESAIYGRCGWSTDNFLSKGHRNKRVERLSTNTIRGKGGDRNKRTVWTVTTEPYSGAHFATFPEALITPCLLAGCPLGGLVLDPFCGTFTVGAVASRLGRRAVGVDLTYQSLAKERTMQRGLPFDLALSV